VSLEDLIAIATVGLLSTPLPLVLIALPFNIDFGYHLIALFIPQHYLLVYQTEFLILRFFIFLHAIIEIMRLVSYKLLLAETVMTLMVSSIKTLFGRIKFLSYYNSILPSLRTYSEFSILVSHVDLTFGNQFTTIVFTTTSCLILIGFGVIKLKNIIQFYVTIFLLILYVCAQTGMQTALRNVNIVVSLSEKLITECKLRTNLTGNKKYWKRKFKAIKPMNFSLRVGDCRLCTVKKSMRVSFIGLVAIYTINAILGIQNSPDSLSSFVG